MLPLPEEESVRVLDVLGVRAFARIQLLVLLRARMHPAVPIANAALVSTAEVMAAALLSSN